MRPGKPAFQVPVPFQGRAGFGSTWQQNAPTFTRNAPGIRSSTTGVRALFSGMTEIFPASQARPVAKNGFLLEGLLSAVVYRKKGLWTVSENIRLDYDSLMRKALRSLVRDALSMVSGTGSLPGNHHFYIEFITRAPGVDIPERLVKEYPERMTIVIQHQFADLVVDDTRFSITLWFGGEPCRFDIPFEAVTSFTDPAVKFGLCFEPAAGEGTGKPSVKGRKPDAGEKTRDTDGKGKVHPGRKSADSAGGTADIVSLDAFRKK